MKKLETVNIGDKLEIDFAYKHPTYVKMYSNWTKCRDFVKGSDAVKNRTYADLHKYDSNSLYSLVIDSEYVLSYVLEAIFSPIYLLTFYPSNA